MEINTFHEIQFHILPYVYQEGYCKQILMKDLIAYQNYTKTYNSFAFTLHLSALLQKQIQC